MSPTIGSLNFSPWYALMMSTSQRMISRIQIRKASMLMNGMKLITINTMNSPRNVIVDCIAWNLTVLFSFSTRKKIMPVKNVSTYVNADAIFSSRPNVAFTIFYTPKLFDQYVLPGYIKRFGNLLNTFVACCRDMSVCRIDSYRNDPGSRDNQKGECCYGDSNPSRERERLA